MGIPWEAEKALHVLIGGLPEWVEIKVGSLKVEEGSFTCIESVSGKTIVGESGQLHAVRHAQPGA